MQRSIFYLISALVILLCCGLSHWQWQRASEKKAILKAYQQQPFVSQALWFAEKASFYRKTHPYVSLLGHYLNKKTIFLDNQMVHHKPGYDVLTAFETKDQHVVWINRGWIRASHNRKYLPVVSDVNGTVTLNAMAVPLKKNRFRIGSVQDPSYPKRFQILDPETLDRYAQNSSAHTNNDAQRDTLQLKRKEVRKPSNVDSVMILQSGQPGALFYHYRLVVLPPERHIGYAIQWFLLATVWAFFTFYAKF